MARFVLFLILLVPLTMAGNWLLGHPGTVHITWLGYEIEAHIAVAATALAVACILAVVVALGLWQVATWPERRKARHRYRTVSKGLQLLTQGMTALALGNETSAEQALRRARATLPGEPLPTLLTAQLLQRQGKQEEARGQFRALLAHASTAQLATQRLIEQHLARREWADATTLAEDAHRDTPRDRWLVLTLVSLYARQGASAQIKALTEGWHWQSPLTRDERHRYAAFGYLLAAAADSTPQARLTSLRHAYGYAPQWLPATLAYAVALLDAGQHPRARKVLLAGWNQQPVAALIVPILRTLEPLNARQQQRMLKPFTHSDSAAWHLLAGMQALDEGDAARAKSMAAQALALEESKQGCALMAEAEKRLNGAEAATVWLARAMDAPRAPGWICQRCGHEHAAWQPHCSSCDTFDTLAYERPETRITSIDVPAASKAATA